MKKKFVLGVILLFVFAIMSLGLWSLRSVVSQNTTFGREAGTGQGRKRQLVTTAYPWYFMVKEVVGDRYEVLNLVPPGIEPHDFEPTASDMVLIQESDLVFFDQWMSGWIEKIDVGDSEVERVDVAGSLTENGDPHIWLSPRLMKEVVPILVNKLVAVDTVNEAYYRENGERLSERLNELYLDYVKGLAVCQRRKAVYAHNAFGYLNREFSIEAVAVTGVSAEEEPSVKKLKEVVEYIKRNNLKYVFYESLLDPRYSQVLAEEAGVQMMKLDSIEGLTAEETALGANYMTKMKNNLDNLRIALECQ